MVYDEPVRRALVGLCMLCGCDSVFLLDRNTVIIEPVIIDPDGDVDGDGDPNATDLCPLLQRTVVGANDDFDGDGVGNLCDPEPQVRGDCLALFDAFQYAGELSPHWRSSGQTITKDDNQMVIPPGTETIVYLDVEFPLTSLTVDGYISDGTGGRRAIQLLFDHDHIAGATGRACSLEQLDPDGSIAEAAVVEIVSGVDTRLTASPLDDTRIGAGTSVLVGWNDRHPETGESFAGSCHAEIADQANRGDQTAVAAVAPRGGAFGLRTLTVGFNVGTIIGYGHDCEQ